MNREMHMYGQQICILCAFAFWFAVESMADQFMYLWWPAVPTRAEHTNADSSTPLSQQMAPNLGHPVQTQPPTVVHFICATNNVCVSTAPLLTEWPCEICFIRIFWSREQLDRQSDANLTPCEIVFAHERYLFLLSCLSYCQCRKMMWKTED